MGTHQTRFRPDAEARIIKSMSVSIRAIRALSISFATRRDVVVSQYHYHRKLKENRGRFPIEKFVTRFLAARRARTVLGTKHRNLVVHGARGNARFLLLRYEDLLADTARELAKVVTFLQLSASPEQIAQAVERSSAIACASSKRSNPTGTRS